MPDLTPEQLRELKRPCDDPEADLQPLHDSAESLVAMALEYHEIRQSLGEALNYPPIVDKALSSNVITVVRGVDTGDATASQLAASAAIEIQELRAQLADARAALERVMKLLVTGPGAVGNAQNIHDVVNDALARLAKGDGE